MPTFGANAEVHRLIVFCACLGARLSPSAAERDLKSLEWDFRALWLGSFGGSFLQKTGGLLQQQDSVEGIRAKTADSANHTARDFR